MSNMFISHYRVNKNVKPIRSKKKRIKEKHEKMNRTLVARYIGAEVVGYSETFVRPSFQVYGIDYLRTRQALEGNE